MKPYQRQIASQSDVLLQVVNQYWASKTDKLTNKPLVNRSLTAALSHSYTISIHFCVCHFFPVPPFTAHSFIWCLPCLFNESSLASNLSSDAHLLVPMCSMRFTLRQVCTELLLDDILCSSCLQLLFPISLWLVKSTSGSQPKPRLIYSLPFTGGLFPVSSPKCDLISLFPKNYI